MRSSIAAAVVVAVWICPACAQEKWRPAFEDSFSRQALGPDWTILRGDWHINAAGQLQVQRQWPSGSHIMCNVPLRGKNVRVELDLILPGGDQKGAIGVYLQAGALGWGAGGIDDRAGVDIRAAT